jgi:hypothetical protein
MNTANQYCLPFAVDPVQLKNVLRQVDAEYIEPSSAKPPELTNLLALFANQRRPSIPLSGIVAIT